MPIQEVTSTGYTDEIQCGVGDQVAIIEATTWDSASVTLQEGAGDSWADCDDPYNTGNALTRTANGKAIRLTGGLSYRLNCTTYGASTAGLRLVINQASR